MQQEVKLDPYDYVITAFGRIGKVHAILDEALQVPQGYVVWSDRNEACWQPLIALNKCDVFVLLKKKIEIDVQKYLV